MLYLVSIDRFGKLFGWRGMIAIRVPELATLVRSDVVRTLSPIRKGSYWHIRVVSEHCVELRHLTILVETRPPALSRTDPIQATEP